MRVPATRRSTLSALVALAVTAPVGAAAEIIGRSVLGRPISLTRIGDDSAAVKVLVVGVIHGNEDAGLSVVGPLLSTAASPGVQLLVVPSVNPDGRRARTRGNAHGVDLNRNFPFRWKRIPSTSRYFSGPRPLSEPESQAVRSMIRRERPALSIWFHQPERNVRDPDSSPEAQRYAGLVGLPFLPLAAPPGTVAEWTEDRVPGTEAFVVELAAGRLSSGAAARHVRAIRILATSAAK